MPQQPSDPTSHEVDRHIDDQPTRDDLLDPEYVDPEAVASDDFARDELAGRDDIVSQPTPVPRELQPETQGSSTVDAPLDTENAGVRYPLSDEFGATDPEVTSTSVTSDTDGLVDDIVPTDEPAGHPLSVEEDPDIEE